MNLSTCKILAAAAALATLTGCSAPPQAAPTPFRPAATIQDIMNSVVDPAADTLWAAVSTEVTAAGVQENLPRTEEAWQAVRHQAIALVEAANLLVVDGRAVSAPGKALEDANTPGILTAEEVRKAIDADPPAFHQRAHALQDAAKKALAAIDAKNPAALVEAGSHIEGACEGCHLKYWYPNGGYPKAVADGKPAAGAAGR